jgi:N-acetylgalactosamine-N,N'-diacetylbacillosaminyl-diphospho-undecaprenol 4-alpha-N-acetylgalactosaminyltransferase
MTENKKLLLTIIPSLHGGGAEKFTADISHGLSQKFDHYLITYNKKENYSYKGQLTHLDTPESENILKKIIRQFQIQKAIRSFKKKINPQTTISHMLMANMHNILSKGNDFTICVLHGEWSVTSGNKILDFFVGRIYKKADLIISVSNHIKNMFDEKYGFNLPHFVIHNAIDIDAVNKASQEKFSFVLPEKYIVYVAGFRPVKNHLQLIKQLENYLKNNDVHLVLVGDGELRPEIETTIESLYLKNKVHLLGNITNPHPVVKRALLSLLVSSSESFSLVLVEAMALGVPVIATDCGGPREILMENKMNGASLPLKTSYGTLIETPEKWSENSLIAEISEIVSNEALRSEFSKNGIERASHFDISKAVELYVELIETHQLSNGE